MTSPQPMTLTGDAPLPAPPAYQTTAEPGTQPRMFGFPQTIRGQLAMETDDPEEGCNS